MKNGMHMQERKASLLKDGKDVTIFACGHMVYESLVAREILGSEDIDARLVNMHTPKPIDEDCIIKAAKETGAIVTAEEHTIAGGFGSAIAEIAAENCPVPVKFVGIRDEFGLSGEPEELFEHFGLKAKNIVQAAKAAIAMKRK